MKALTVIVCLAIAGCAFAPAPKEKIAPLLPGEVRSAKAASEALAIGRSTKADVRAALGQATVIDFHSGYEVWLYREKPEKSPPAHTGELVLLFAPSGVLSKARFSPL